MPAYFYQTLGSSARRVFARRWLSVWAIEPTAVRWMRPRDTDQRRLREFASDAQGRGVGPAQAECAERALLERRELAKIETAARRVGAVELARPAEALDMRVEWFFDEAPMAVVSRRNAGKPGAPGRERQVPVEQPKRDNAPGACLAGIGDTGELLPRIRSILAEFNHWIEQAISTPRLGTYRSEASNPVD